MSGYIDGRSLIIKKCKCNKIIDYRSTFCKSCSKKGKLNPAYIDGHYNKPRYCKDCFKLLSTGSKLGFCKKCSEKLFSGKNSYRYGKSNNHGKTTYYSGQHFRSTWEANFAKFLTLSGIKWQYESKTFDLGNTTYTPDFYLPEWDCYIEVKGYWRDDAKEKFNRFKNLYFNLTIFLYDKIKLKQIGVI